MRKFPTQSGGLSSDKHKLLELRLKQKGISIPETRVIPKRKELDPCPLSFAQQRLWFLDQLRPGSTVYLIAHALRFQGDLSIETLERSLEELVHRHESLRTTFRMQAGQPVQVIHPVRGWILPVIDLQGLRQEHREETAQWLAKQEAQHPCDLEVGPLLRTYLLQLETQEYVVLLTLHHIITDGWSNEVLVRELTTLYHSFIAGQPSPLAPLPIQYADYALWQREWLQGKVLETQLAYWQKQLAGILPLALFTDHPRPPIQTHQGDAQWLQLSPVLSEELMALSKQEDVTLFMLLLTAFQILLMRYIGQTDISVGTPIANRRQAELEGVIGFFVNTLVMRSNLSDNPTFLELLSRVREVCLEAYAHQDIPFEKVVQELEPERDLSRSPLFQVMFVLQNAPQEQGKLAGMSIKSLALKSTISKFDLTLSIWETGQELHCGLEYSTDLFEAETVRRMLAHWQRLLQGIVDNPQAHVSDLPMLREGEREQLLVGWNATRKDYLQGLCVHQLFEQQVERTPEAVAVLCEQITLTYGELNRRANQLAHHLHTLGVGPEVLVGVCLERSLDLVIALVAILKAGGVYVPLDPAYPVKRLDWMLEDIQPAVLLTQQSVGSTLSTLEVRQLCLDTDGHLWSQEPSTNGVSPLTAENLAYIIYTSGSTGRPKGAMVHQRGMLNHLMAKITDLQLGEQDRLAQTASQCFDISVWQLLAGLLVGGCTVIYSNEVVAQPTRLIEGMQLDQISICETVPSFLRAILESIAAWSQEERSLPMLRWLIPTGEALPIDLCCKWFDCYPNIGLLNAYGPTECSDDVTHYPFREAAASTLVSVPIGQPVNNMRMYVLDPRLKLVPIGTIGELYIGGVGVGRGYLKDAHRTAEAFVPDPFALEAGMRLYKTGDLVRYRLDGAIEFVGRVDQQVKIRGFRIELGEIEAVLGQHSAVREVVVQAREDGLGEKRLVAYPVVQQGHTLTMSELRFYLQDRLPAYMIPSAFVPLDALPLTPHGKVDRRALPVPEEGHDGNLRVLEGARTPIEDLLVGLWSEVLGCRQVGIHEHFFELGGHSLLATQLIARVRAMLRVEIPLRVLFEAPTVAGLAQRVEQALCQDEALKGPPLLAGPRPREIPLSFAQQRLWFLDQLQPESTAYLVPHAHHLSGPLNTVALERSLEEMVQRHESLHTTFVADADQPMQVIHPTGHYCLPLVDLCGLGQEKRKHEAQKLAKQEGQHPCDLERGPLLRTYLLQLDSEEYVLLLTLHHIITDGWSNEVLVRELITLYRADVSGQPSPLASLPIQYADYALWQRQWLQGEMLEAQLDYWTRRLGGSPPIELPTDYPRPLVPSSRGAAHSFVLSEDLSQALGVLSRQEGVTLFMTLLAAFQVLFYRSTGQLDIVIGTDSANRNRVETERIIGFFVNLLTLRTDLSGKPTFREVLKRVREVVLGAYTHQDTPFELLVEKLAPDHYLDRAPLVQVLFVLQNIFLELERGVDTEPQVEHETVDQSPLRPSMEDETMVKFDLALFMQERTGKLFGTLNYRLDLFRASTIATMVTRFEVLLQHIVKQPDIPIDLLEMASDGERAQQEQEQRDARHELLVRDDGWFDLPEMDLT